MTKIIKILYTALLLVLVFCLGVGTTFSKYITEIELDSFRLVITASFSGIVTNQKELEIAINSGRSYEVQGGTYTSQILADGVGVEVIVNSAVVDFNGMGALKVTNGGKMIINDATVTTYTNTPGAVQAMNGSTLIINGGTFTRDFIIIGDDTSTVEINGGTFTYPGHMGTLNGYFIGGAAVGTLIIRGGTFSADPSTYVAEGYEAVQNEDGTWTVVCSHLTLGSCSANSDHTTHSGTCDQCKKTIKEAHALNENGQCTKCGYKTIVNNNQLSTAVESGLGTAENPVEIGGGTWEKENVWTEWNPDRLKRLTLNIYEGEFNDWLIYISNADVVIYGGVFKTDCFYMDGGTTIKICGGDWTAVDSFTFTEDANANITGGRFGFDVTKWVRTEGYTCVDNGDGTWTVQPSS